MITLTALAVSALTLAAHSDPTFTLRTPNKTLSYKRSELLQRKDVTQLELDYDPSFPKKQRKYTVVPIAPLFEGIEIPKDWDFKFECLDGFSAPISPEKLLATAPQGSIAYLAIEAPDETWPKVTSVPNGPSPAPYYLVWKNPKASKIGPEQWPYQLAGFVAQEPLAKAYPKLVPDPKLPAHAPEQRGLAVFVKNCFPCHTMNQEGGTTKLGPDLNMPMNPTEYLTEKGFRTLVRNPQELRWWPQSRMSPFSEKTLPNSELKDLTAYLKHMAGRRN